MSASYEASIDNWWGPFSYTGPTSTFMTQAFYEACPSAPVTPAPTPAPTGCTRMHFVSFRWIGGRLLIN